jgi:hypothetical protein
VSPFVTVRRQEIADRLDRIRRRGRLGSAPPAVADAAEHAARSRASARAARVVAWHLTALTETNLRQRGVE